MFFTADLTSSGYTSTNGGTGANNAFDNNAGTWWLSSHMGTDVNGVDWIGQDFGSGVTYEIRQYVITQFGVGFAATSIKVEYSDNFSDWTTLQIDTFPNDGTTQIKPVMPGAAHRFWRLRANSDLPAGTTWIVREIEMMEALGFTARPDLARLMPGALARSAITTLVRNFPIQKDQKTMAGDVAYPWLAPDNNQSERAVPALLAKYWDNTVRAQGDWRWVWHFSHWTTGQSDYLWATFFSATFAEVYSAPVSACWMTAFGKWEYFNALMHWPVPGVDSQSVVGGYVDIKLRFDQGSIAT